MGLLIDGAWQDQWYDTTQSGGKFIRSDSQFRNWVTLDGAPGPSGRGGFAGATASRSIFFSCPAGPSPAKTFNSLIVLLKAPAGPSQKQVTVT